MNAEPPIGRRLSIKAPVYVHIHIPVTIVVPCTYQKVVLLPNHDQA